VQVFFQDLGVNFYGVRALASEELFKVASLVIGGASLPTLPEDANPLEGQCAEDANIMDGVFIAGVFILSIAGPLLIILILRQPEVIGEFGGCLPTSGLGQ
jgi:hypothetical protein